MTFRQRLGQAIKMAREMRGITQVALSDTIGVTQGRLSEYENGSRMPSDRVIEAIEQALSTDIRIKLERF